MVDDHLVAEDITLSEFLSKKFLGSSLSVRDLSKNGILLESDSVIRIHVQIDERKKEVNFDLYSPRWDRRITVQQLDGFEFMESQAEEQLEKEEAESISEDSLLALDMIRLWAANAKYKATEIPPSKDIPSAPR